jgi:AraC family transcriptional regulator, activator of mtrCDE
MSQQVLDRLLTTLDVHIHAFAVCEVARGSHLAFEPMNAVVVHYVLAGKGVLYVQGCEPIAFGPHSILIVPANAAQTLAADARPGKIVRAAEHCSMLVDGLVKFDAAHRSKADLLTICGTITATLGGSLGLFDALASPLVEDLSSVDIVKAGFDQLLHERSHPTIGTRAVSDAVMKQCLVLVLRQHLSRYGATSPLFSLFADARLSRAIHAVIEHPAAQHSVASLAAAAAMSRSAFAKHFQSVLGQTPMEFVQKCRLHHAARMLATTDLPVKVIAASMGYASRSHFSRAFRAAYGMDPTKFRRVGTQAPVDPPHSLL